MKYYRITPKENIFNLKVNIHLTMDEAPQTKDTS